MSKEETNWEHFCQMKDIDVIIHLISCAVLWIHGTLELDCTSGWFGSKCQHQCHCASNNTCGKDGKCLDNVKCAIGFFGFNCQYRDLAQEIESIEPIMVDNNDSTCLTESTLKELVLTLPFKYSVRWIRLVKKAQVNLNELRIKFRSDQGEAFKFDCMPQIIRNDDVTVDVYCDTKEPIKSVLVYGNSLNGLCTINISAGRQLALKQHSEQHPGSKTPFSTSDKAVDGNKEQLFERHSCSQTLDNDLPWWQVNFQNPSIISHFDIYPILPSKGAQVLLENFKIDIQRTDDTVQVEGIKHAASKMSFNFNDWSKPTVSLKAFHTNTTSIGLCEVDVYGEDVCPFGYYGTECDHHCRCAKRSDSCIASTGSCESGCAEGYHGPGCSHSCKKGRFGVNCLGSCSKFCRKSITCNFYDGACIHGCQKGYQAPLCFKVCEKGTYGYNCSKSCSGHCLKDTCDRMTGYCSTCSSGYTGKLCNEKCPKGSFGPGCGAKCSEHCARDRVCDFRDGQCLYGCRGGYKGNRCQEKCKDETYGLDCAFKCSRGCSRNSNESKQVCDNTTGECLHGCQKDFVGPTCIPDYKANVLKDKVEPVLHKPGAATYIAEIVSGLGLAVIILILALAIIVLGRKKRRKRRQVSESSIVKKNKNYDEEGDDEDEEEDEEDEDSDEEDDEDSDEWVQHRPIDLAYDQEDSDEWDQSIDYDEDYDDFYSAV